MKTVSPTQLKQRIEQLRLVCQNTGMRMTHQRMEIFREVAQTTEHPDAEKIFMRVRKRMPTISHDTVYRTLASLEEAGLVRRIETLAGRARYDANSDIHHHFICTQCGAISDLYLTTEPALPAGIEELGSAESVHLQIRGVCHMCKNNNPGETNAKH